MERSPWPQNGEWISGMEKQVAGRLLRCVGQRWWWKTWVDAIGVDRYKWLLVRFGVTVRSHGVWFYVGLRGSEKSSEMPTCLKQSTHGFAFNETRIRGKCACLVCGRVQLCGTPWTVARQALLSMGFPRQEYWSGLPFHPPGDLLNPGIKPTSPESPVLEGKFFTHWAIGKALEERVTWNWWEE